MEAEWNPGRQLWETGQEDLFSGEAEPFAETWPTSGMTRAGRLLPLPALPSRSEDELREALRNQGLLR